jgi:uncharacterized membrane protein
VFFLNHLPWFAWLRHRFVHKDNWLFFERALFIFACGLTLFFTLVVPPFQKPDEPTHFAKAVSLAKGNIVCHKASNGVFNNQVPRYLAELPLTFLTMHIASSRTVVFPLSLYTGVLKKTDWDKTLVNEPSSCSLPFVLYIPAALAIALPVQLGWNPLVIFYIGRLANAAVGLVVSWWAIKRTPRRLRLLPVFLLSIPMFAYQISSYSKDALHLSFGLLVFSYLAHFHEEHKKISPQEILIFFASLLLVVFARPQYVPLVLLAFIIPRQKVKSLPLSVRKITVGFILGILLLIGIALSLEIFSAKASSLGNGAPNSFIYPDLQLHYILEKPWRFIEVLNTTFERKMIFLSQGAVGLFGWFEYGLSWWIYPIFAGLGWYVLFLLYSEWRPLAFRHWLLLTMALVGSLVGLTLAMYLYGSPVAGETVEGLQGRYFLLLVPFGFWWLSSTFARWSRLFLIGGLIVVSGSIMWLVASRYYYNTAHAYIEPGWFSDEATKANLINKSNFVVQGTHEQLLTLKPGKKLAGMTLVSLPNKKSVTKPYKLILLEEDCQGMLRDVVVEAQALKASPERKLAQIPFLPIEVPASGKLCVKIEPFNFVAEPDEELLLLPTAQQTSVAPMYLY